MVKKIRERQKGKIVNMVVAAKKEDEAQGTSRFLGEYSNCWEALFNWGDEVQKTAGFTAEDHKKIIEKVRKAK